jgi:hypothetical protein
MILTEVRDYLRREGQATLGDIARAVHTDRETARSMLEFWMRKGLVRQLQAGGGCAGCTQCAAVAANEATEIYRWSDPAQRGADLLPLVVAGKGCR